ncbi:amino acid/polyamine/organocation transporter (APC superfamily) [Frondihabitans sp. PhB188]|uniref:APC family permease n=1 Tax=Frondihabitans sp. PhB188 TaxID=2485200 RepID=UPI000F49539E|nr:amino acid permease [Frondihabitans sp. PhB188]ROQ40792.1 amino acid/polyamine/organocation transporter (APC superfamily) [Frondihabitans sp. PhB188]
MSSPSRSTPLSPRTEPAAVRTDSAEPNALGYPQDLHRGVGSFASFAAGFSFVSILTTVFQLFGLGFSFGGAAFFWAWPVVFVGQLMVALNFAQLAAWWPISGAIFQWSSRLAGSVVGWFTGWTMIIGQILTVAVAAVAVQAVLPAIWSGFQIVGGPTADSAPLSATGAQNAVVLGIIMLAITTAVNIVSVKLMARVTSVGVTIEIVGVVVLVAALFLLPERSASVVFTPEGRAPGGSYLWVWLASALMAAYVMVGFDSAGELSEETHAPRRTTPKTIIRALTVSGLGGALLIVAALVAAPSLSDGSLVSGGLAGVVESRLGGVLGRLLLCCVAVAVFACTLAVQTSGSRMVYSMARERALPFSAFLARVSPRTGTPIATSVVVGVAAAIALAVNSGNSALFTALSSLCIAMLYLAYLGVTVPLLVRRLQGWTRDKEAGVDEDGRPLFSMGRWAIPVNVVAVVFQVLMVINLAWPRAAIYDLTGHSWWLQWSALLFITATLLVGGAYYAATHRRHSALRLVPTTAAIPLVEAA